MTDTSAAGAVVVLISGRGSNLQSLLDGVQQGSLAADIRCVISNVAGAQGLDRAAAAGVPTRILPHAGFAHRQDFDAALAECILEYSPRLVVLAGFMRVLGSHMVRRFQGRMVNIHPSLLPAFPGLHTHRQALATGVREHGASVHYVSPELDSGPVIAQVRVPVLAGDTPDSLAARVLQGEHRLLPRVVGWILSGRVALGGDTVLFDGAPLATPKQIQGTG